MPDNGIAPTSIGGGAADAAAADDETAAASNANADYADPATAAASAAQADAAQAQPTYQSPRGGRNQVTNSLDPVYFFFSEGDGVQLISGS